MFSVHAICTVHDYFIIEWLVCCTWAKKNIKSNAFLLCPWSWRSNIIFYCCLQVHLLCLLSHTLQQNRLCNDELLKAVALSLLPSARISPSTWRVSTLSDYVFWFRQVVDIDTMLSDSTSDMVRIREHFVLRLRHWHCVTTLLTLI